MKRDMDLVRKILIWAEDRDESLTAPRPDNHLAIDGYDDRVVALHVKLLQEAGFLEASFVEADGFGIVFARVRRLTWAGYEFLAAARDDTVWAQTKGVIKSKTRDVPFSVLQALLIEGVKQIVGLQ